MNLQKHLEVDENGLVKDVDIDIQAEYLSAFTGVPIDDLLEGDIHDIKKAFEIGLNSFNTYRKKKPQQIIKVDGKEYELLIMEHQKGGWYVDVKTMAADFEDHPELVAALNYVEKGMKYSQKDKEKRLLNPTRDRAKIFRQHFPADAFLNLSDFFLQKFELLTKISLEYQMSNIQKMTKKASQEILGSNGLS